MWGASPEEQATRRAAADPLLKVPMTSELGCVTPWVVAPGAWSEEELTHQARALTEGMANNVRRGVGFGEPGLPCLLPTAGTSPHLSLR